MTTDDTFHSTYRFVETEPMSATNPGMRVGRLFQVMVPSVQSGSDR